MTPSEGCAMLRLAVEIHAAVGCREEKCVARLLALEAPPNRCPLCSDTIPHLHPEPERPQASVLPHEFKPTYHGPSQTPDSGECHVCGETDAAHQPRESGGTR